MIPLMAEAGVEGDRASTPFLIGLKEGIPMMDDHMYRWPQYYDWTSDGLDGDVTYYAHLAMESGGPVLELGCGTGRCSLGMARHGIEVVGVDRQPEMIQTAQKKAEAMGLDRQCQWVCGDMTQLQLGRRFPLVVIPYRSFLHLLRVKDQLDTLRTIRDHLTEDGLLAFNLFVPDLAQMVEEDERLVNRGQFPIPGTREVVEVHDYMEYDHFYQQASVIRYYERFSAEGVSLERLRTSFAMRYIFPTELFHLLDRAGFHVVKRYGGFRGEPFGPGSEELVVEAKPAHEGRAGEPAPDG